ncbi:glycine receptor subunit alpha-1-like [Palaemon carinicauda]|uniref:glycine receptor subunit alpha-1-like n=1 Tax=Palaemon carinicauda TaxID=392227 RepID=UPI0035B6A69C
MAVKTAEPIRMSPDSFHMCISLYSTVPVAGCFCILSDRVITKIACPMDFTAYPFDKQICFMRLEGYQYRTFEVEYSWHETGIQISNSLRTDHFVANFQIDGNERVQHENSATFPSVQVRISLYRKMSYHVMNTYIPSGLFVIVSWLTFFIPVDVVPGRMVLTITTLLTMVSMFSTVRSESPKVSYAKAICCIWAISPSV